MQSALAEAAKASHAAEVPVGALVVNGNGIIIATAHNSPEALHDPTAHAEILALRAAGGASSNYRLEGCVLVVTLEPCMMCAGAMAHARIAGVVYGAADPAAGAVASRLEALDQPFLNHHPWHMGGICEAQCAALIQDFFRGKRVGE